MKHITLYILALVISFGALAQNSTAPSQTITQVMVVRLSETDSPAYKTGNAEIKFTQFIDLVEANSKEIEVTSEKGESLTFTKEPTLVLIEDKNIKPLPVRTDNQSCLDYINHLSELVADKSEYNDFIVIGMTKRGLGLVYSRVEPKTVRKSNDLAVDKSEAFKVFPNPTSSTVKFTGLSEGLNPIVVLDSMGKLVLETKIMNNEELDVSSLSSGTYTVLALIENEFYTRKLIVE